MSRKRSVKGLTPPENCIWIFVNKIDSKAPWALMYWDTQLTADGIPRWILRHRTATTVRIGSIVQMLSFPHAPEGTKPRAVVSTSGMIVWDRNRTGRHVTIYPSPQDVPRRVVVDSVTALGDALLQHERSRRETA